MSLTRSHSMTRITEEKGTNQEELEMEEPDPTSPESDDDSSSESEDEDAHLKQIKPSNGFSIRRNDSFASFLTRSERAALLGKDKPPSPEEERKRKVHFVEDSELDTIHEVDLITEEDKPQVYMTGEDFGRIETDVKMTNFRWENHLAGKIKFDASTNTMRGLEHLDRDASRKSSMQKYKHNRAVMEEINRQKQDYDGTVRDWEVVRKISQQFSVHSTNHAVELGRLDREAHQKAWNAGAATSASAASASPNQDKKKKKKFFWQKK